MATAELEKLIEQVRSLTPEERTRLRRAIDSLPKTSPEEELDRRMRESGFIQLGARGPREPAPEPVRIEGKPLSEELIEERR